MKQKSTLRVILITFFMLILSATLTWLFLQIFGKLSENPIQDDQKFSFNTNFVGLKISQNDYEDYPVITDSIIPTYMKNYLLPPEDAAVLAAKQIEKITGISLKGLTANISFNIYDKCWEGAYISIVDSNEQSTEKSFYMDAVSGEVFGYGDGFNSYEIQFSKDDYNKCVEKAMLITQEMFPYDSDNLQAFEPPLGDMNKFVLSVIIYINEERTASYLFAQDENEQYYIYAFSTR